MKKREIRVIGNFAFVRLTKGYEAIIDADDVPTIGAHNWYALVKHRGDGSVRAVYAARNQRIDGRTQTILMHRLLMSTPDSLDTDHIDCNGLNNVRSNLRFATTTQNALNQRIRSDNSSGFKGVSFVKNTGVWKAVITVNGRKEYIGSFKTPELASSAYEIASAKFHGEFGRIS